MIAQSLVTTEEAAAMSMAPLSKSPLLELHGFLDNAGTLKRPNKGKPERRRLSPHAVDRMLERSNRSLGWLEKVIADKQFAYLRPREAKRRSRVLVFDVLADEWLVVVLSPTSQSVITVLTQAQYENTFGPIPAVFFGLATMARTQPLRSEFPPTPWKLESGLIISSCAWTAVWNVKLRFEGKGSSSSTQLTLTLGTEKRKKFILDSIAKAQACAADPALLEPSTLSFGVLAKLLVRSDRFQEWLFAAIQENDRKAILLRYVGMSSANLEPNVRANVTEDLLASLTAV